jgi:hypothetical protein
VLGFCNDYVGLEGFRAIDSYGRQSREVSSLASKELLDGTAFCGESEFWVFQQTEDSDVFFAKRF